MTNFNDTVSAEALVVKQGVHSGPSAAGEPGAINGSVHVYNQDGHLASGLEAGTVRAYDGGGTLHAELCVDASTKVGRVYLSNAAAQTQIHIDGTGVIYACNAKGEHTVQIDGNSGDILMFNADIAEEFDVADHPEDEVYEPGTVVSLVGEARVCASVAPYDRAVAGVIAGAGRYRPGIVLDRRPTETRRVPVSLFGKVMCKVDASYGSIAPGDPLTTSGTAGHAMRAHDTAPIGSVIGKSLGGLTAGTGLVPMLICMR